MYKRDLKRQLRDTAEHAGEQARDYVDGANGTARELLERGRQRIHERFGGRGSYGQQLGRVAEDFADEANYRYRRLRRQVNRHPGTTLAIAAGTLGAFLLLRRVFRSNDDE